LREYLADALGLEKALSSLPETVEIRFGFEWTSAFTKQTDKIFVSDSPRFEIAMVLATLAFAGMNETSVLITQGDPAEATKLTANRLCELAGLWDYLSSFSGIPMRNSSELLSRKPIEVASVSACNALSNVCMAQAEELGAFSAMFRDIKLSLVAKLFVHAYNLYREADRHFQQLLRGPPELLKPETQFVSEYIVIFVGVKTKLMLAMAHKCAAMDHKLKESHGNALAHMLQAKHILSEAKELQNTSSVLGSRSDDLAAVLWSELCEQEPSILHLQEKYERENESVFLERVPEANQLLLPQATSVFQMKPFTLLSTTEATTVDITLKNKKNDTCSVM